MPLVELPALHRLEMTRDLSLLDGVYVVELKEINKNWLHIFLRPFIYEKKRKEDTDRHLFRVQLGPILTDSFFASLHNKARSTRIGQR